MKHFKLIVPVLILLLAITVPPIVVTNIIAGSAGLLMIRNFASEVVFWDVAEASERVVPILVNDSRARQQTVVRLNKGYVQFQQVDGKLTSRFFKNTEGVTT